MRWSRDRSGPRRRGRGRRACDGRRRHRADRVELTGGDGGLLYHPAAAAGDDLRQLEVGREVVGPDATGGHEARLPIRRGDGLEVAHTAGGFGREELEQGDAAREREGYLGRCAHARQHRHARPRRKVDNGGVEPGGDQEPGPGRDRPLCLIHGKDGTGADRHFGHLGRDGCDGAGRRVGPEGDLGARQAAAQQGPRQGNGGGDAGDLDDRDDTKFAQ